MNTLRAKNRKPTHPGVILREDVLPSLKIVKVSLPRETVGLITERLCRDTISSDK